MRGSLKRDMDENGRDNLCGVPSIISISAPPREDYRSELRTTFPLDHDELALHVGRAPDKLDTGRP